MRACVELPEMRAALERLAMQALENFVGKRRHGLGEDGQRFAVDLVAPAAALYQVPQREQEATATGVGENGLQRGVARFALPFDRLAQAVEVDIRSRRGEASDGHLREHVPIPRRAELLHQPLGFAVDGLE